MASPTSRVVAPALLGALLSLGALGASAQPSPPAAQDAAAQTEGSSKRFACQDGGTLLARFTTERGRLVAIVDAFDGDGPHTLPWRPYTEGPVRLTWSDGLRTLVWSPGVQIMWMAADVHRMCGRAGHHH
ncbi:MAG: hypothetical protein ACHP9T_14975 [Caulobacterales bacterium]